MLDNMKIYEMDPASIAEDALQKLFCPQMDRWMSGQMERWTRWNQYTLFNFYEAGGLIITLHYQCHEKIR